MSWTHIQTTGNQSSGSGGSSLAKAYGSNVTAGNLLIVGVYANNLITPTINAPTDTQGNTYTQQANGNDGGSNAIAVFTATANATGANTVTANSGVADYIGMVIAEYSGLGAAGASNINGGTSAAPSVAGGGDTSSGQLLWGLIGVGPGGANAITHGTGFAERYNGAAGMSAVGIEAEDKTVSAISSASWTLASSAAYIALVIGFDLAVAYDPSTAAPFNDAPPSRPLRPPTRNFRADPGVDLPWAALLPLPVGPPTVMPPVDTPPLSLRRATRDFRADPGVDPSTFAWFLPAAQPSYQMAWDAQQGLAPRPQRRPASDFTVPIFPEQQDVPVLMPAWSLADAPLLRRPRVLIVSPDMWPAPLYLPPDPALGPLPYTHDAAVARRRPTFRPDPGCDAPSQPFPTLVAIVAGDAPPRFVRRAFVAAPAAADAPLPLPVDLPQLPTWQSGGEGAPRFRARVFFAASTAADAPLQLPAVDASLLPVWQADVAARDRPTPRLAARAAGDLAGPQPADPAILPDWQGADAVRFSRPVPRPAAGGDLPPAVPPDDVATHAAWQADAPRRFPRPAFVAAPTAEPPLAWLILPASWPTWDAGPGLALRTPPRRPGDQGDGFAWRVVAVDREPFAETWAVQSPNARWFQPRRTPGETAEPPSTAAGVVEVPWLPQDADQPRRRPVLFIAAQGPSDPWAWTGAIVVAGPYTLAAADLFCAGVVAGDVWSD